MVISLRKIQNKHCQYYISHKITAAQNEDALSYHGMRGLYFLAVVFTSTI